MAARLGPTRGTWRASPNLSELHCAGGHTAQNMPKKLHSSWAWRNKYTERVARPAVFFLLLLVTFQEGSAATGWERLSELRPGDAITVVQMDRKEYSGEFIRVDAGNL